MGILSNTVSICQFRVSRNPPGKDLFEWASRALAGMAFHSIDDSPEDDSSGWVHLYNTNQCDFETPNGFWYEHYMAFALRRDQRRIPPALFKARLARAESEYLADHPDLRWIPKPKKEEMRESVRFALLAKTLPVPASYDVVWDMGKGTVTFANLGNKLIELFVGLFEKTFQVNLFPVHPFYRAERVLGDDLIAELHNANKAATNAALDLINENRWLGCDFMLWLLYQTMQTSSEYQVNQSGPAESGAAFAAYLNDRVVLVGGGESGIQKITVAGKQDKFNEVRAALLQGKQITEGTVCIEKEENIWKMHLKGDVFHFASFRMPSVKMEKDNLTDQVNERDAVFYERMHLLEQGLQLFDSLYCTFLHERLGPGWLKKEKDIAAWVASGKAGLEAA